ncbi:hypothetical protein HOLleu_13345 [Holothuria leucospilota]|uniref:Uncharacterized protein n=1 Tax=Holothuria leucospilota TaxID=206669 RepID=A0A9Q1CCE2_HOLLE|nr:hypothetical protein HOLleu_13345 [Holothuria leucospilota]
MLCLLPIARGSHDGNTSRRMVRLASGRLKYNSRLTFQGVAERMRPVLHQICNNRYRTSQCLRKILIICTKSENITRLSSRTNASKRGKFEIYYS